MDDNANEPLPDNLRCKRTDGRRWRCARRVMDGSTFCELHYIQAKHRQYRRKVPESLKLQRKDRNSKENSDSGEIRVKKDKKKNKKKSTVGKSEALDEAVKKMKLKRGDLPLELIRMVLKREVEKRTTRKKKKTKKNKVSEDRKTNNERSDSEEEEEEEEDVMRELPYGLMAISPAKNLGNVGSCSNSTCDVKIGADSEAATRRCFRSKNIEPMPIGTLQAVPYKKELLRSRAAKRKKCHWCRRSGLKTLIRCSSCQKEAFCLDCIKNHYSDIQEEEVENACPVCRGTCRCKACAAMDCRDVECEGFSKDNNKLNKVLHFHYLICMLLPILKQINQAQSLEVEIEAIIKGKKPSDVQIHQAEVGDRKQLCCNNCNISILDMHRSCQICSYRLCLSCSRNILQRSGTGSVKGCLRVSSKKLSDRIKNCNLKQKNGCKYPGTSMVPHSWEAPNSNGSITCPPSEFGGCGDGVLDLSSIFPLSWMKELEVSAEEIVGCYELPETVDIQSHCSYCHGVDKNSNEIKQLQEAARRENSYDDFLYYPSFVDSHGDYLDHFQKHWGKGHPVIVQNVLKDTSDLCWDPIVMFCTFLKNNTAKPDLEKETQWFDWFEVEIGVRQIFMGSFKGLSHANKWNERLKLKGWLSSQLFREHFSAHHSEILNALPLPEYMNPISGVLNVAAELPQDVLKPDLGPSVYISFGSGENLVQADSVTNLRYDSYDLVNILACATDVPVSTEQLNYIRKLMKKQEEQNGTGESASDMANMEEVIALRDVVGEMHLHEKVSRVSWFSAASQESRCSSLNERSMLLDGEHDSQSDSDTDTDTEVSRFFCRPHKSSRTLESSESFLKRSESSDIGEKKIVESCGAQWDVFRRQDIPKLAEYLQRHSDEFTQTYGLRKHVVHPILDQQFFLDPVHKMRLKEEFKIEPWTFEQHVGEAVIIPAGCAYQVRNLKSCVSVVLDFVSPENATKCIQLVDQLQQLPNNDKAKVDSLEVKKMAICSISRAVKGVRDLTCAETSGELNNSNTRSGD